MNWRYKRYIFIILAHFDHSTTADESAWSSIPLSTNWRTRSRSYQLQSLSHLHCHSKWLLWTKVWWTIDFWSYHTAVHITWQRSMLGYFPSLNACGWDSTKVMSQFVQNIHILNSIWELIHSLNKTRAMSWSNLLIVAFVWFDNKFITNHVAYSSRCTVLMVLFVQISII